MGYKKDNRGFTILEIAISLFIISMGMVAVLTLVVQNIQVENVDKNKVVASQLAQEGLEVVRNQRDFNWLQYDTPTSKWNEGIEDGNYIVDYTGDITDGPDSISATSTRLYINGEGYYDHDDSGKPTPFSRLMVVESSTSASTSVSCLVEWEDKGNTYSYEADTTLYNWR